MTRVLTIPVRPYSPGISIQLPEDTISEADWAVLMAVLDAVKPALVEQPRNAYSTDDLNEAASELRTYSDLLAARGSGGAMVRAAEISRLADRLDAHERET